MVIDVITYNGEAELFDLRYNILKDYVDEFIVVEFDKTFSGNNKQITFPMIKKNKIIEYLTNKVSYYPISSDSVEKKYKELAESSPNTVGAEHWKTEFMQKESIKDCLTDLKDDDIVFIGDCDEIWDPKILSEYGYPLLPIKLNLRVYTYYLNNRSSEAFCGTLQSRYEDIKGRCLNDLRNNSDRGISLDGWHFTSMAQDLRKKLEDSYTKETYANDSVMQHLDENIKNNKDFLGRNFEYKIDESEWPQYLKDNRMRFKHLLK